MNQAENVALGDRALSKTIRNLCSLSEEKRTRSGTTQQLLGSVPSQQEILNNSNSVLFATALLPGQL